VRRHGLNVIYLGANVPAEQFSNTVKPIKVNGYPERPMIERDKERTLQAYQLSKEGTKA
jgi:hypothetical protein